jgi:hypothetical protein
MSYLVTSLGITQTAFWSCLDCGDQRRRRFGEEHEPFRETAAEHVRRTGHTVTIIRGTDELLTGVNYLLPDPPDALSEHLTAHHPGIGQVGRPGSMYPGQRRPNEELEWAHAYQHEHWPASQDHAHERAIRA